jgi:lincosamide nucleotidyltransferase A/C/D/E
LNNDARKITPFGNRVTQLTSIPMNDEFSNISAQLAALAEIDQLLPHHNVEYWLFGGWAVDFHAGRVTREHGDIDIAIWAEDSNRLAMVLLEHGWLHRPDVGEDGYTCYERNGLRLEIAFLARDNHGQVYTPLRHGRGEWPVESFGDEIAQLRSVRARVIGRESLIADKSIARSDGVTAEKDRADIVSLLRST